MKNIAMSERDYDYALHLIKETLEKEDVENKNGIVSFYDMVQYAEKGLDKLKDVVKPNSKLAKELNSSNPLNFMTNNYYTYVSSENSYIKETCKSTIKIISSITGEEIILTKSKGNSLITITPSNNKTQALVKKHLNTILETFNILENYSYFLGGINEQEKCSTHVYGSDSFYFVRLYYNNYGQIKTEIELLWKYNTEQSYVGRKSLKNVLEKNKDRILRKLPIDLNRNFNNRTNNHMLLLAKQEYFKEQSMKNQKKKVLK